MAAADLVHWHANPAHFPDAVAETGHLRSTTVRVVTVHHVADGDRYVVDAAVANADRLHVPCAQTASAVRSAPMPVHVIPYVLEPAPSSPRRPRADDRWVVGWCGKSGGIDDRKRLRTLIDALALLSDRDPVLRLQGWVDESVLAAAAAAGVVTTIEPTRSWADRWEFYDQIDVYCSPSVIEGGPLTVFEAAARGVPVVTTSVGMAAALLDAGGAWPADADDPTGLATTLAVVADASAAARTERAHRAREVIEGFGADHVVGMYEALYGEALGIELPAPSSSRVQPRIEFIRPRLAAPVRAWRSLRVRAQRIHGIGSEPYYSVGSAVPGSVDEGGQDDAIRP